MGWPGGGGRKVVEEMVSRNGDINVEYDCLSESAGRLAIVLPLERGISSEGSHCLLTSLRSLGEQQRDSQKR